MDVLYVRDLVAKEYNADPNRIYLMGNSSGGSAVWNSGVKYPERWGLPSPQCCTAEDANFPYEKLKTVPVLVVHGDMDTTMVFDASKVMVDVTLRPKGLTRHGCRSQAVAHRCVGSA